VINVILCVVGPTAVGKTKLSIELAKKYNAIIINCDAMQVYQELNIGTAKPTKEEQEGITHLLLDFVPVDYFYTVYDYQKDARKLLEQYKDRNIIFVGGTGLYLKAALFDYRFKEENYIKETFDDVSNEDLYKMALERDSNMSIHPNNRQRLVRFLNKDVSPITEPVELYKATFIGLTTDRSELYKRIDKRVDLMVKMGLIEEVKGFYDRKIDSKVVNTAIGYKELYSYFDGNISLPDAINEIKKKSRHYAKRQYTFFKNQLPVTWFETNYDDFNKTIDEVEEYIEKDK
jgi:tRNA dimethylallyltransferase